MEKSKLIKLLVSMSSIVGKEVAYVQGAGGNTSVKFSDSEMAIKSSGINLKDISVKSGISIVDFKSLNQFLMTSDVSEDKFSDKVNTFQTESTGRPSIETGFHSYLGKFVIHTHSVFTNILNCSVEGKDQIKKLFPEAILIKYATPGRDLTKEIINNIPYPPKLNGIIFLESHGIIVWAENSEEAISIHENISKKIISAFNLPPFLFDQKKSYSLVSDSSQILFPDQAVFTLAGDKILNSPSAQETICSHNYIVSSIQSIGFKPMFLSKKESSKLINMESEKYRQSLITK